MKLQREADSDVDNYKTLYFTVRLRQETSRERNREVGERERELSSENFAKPRITRQLYNGTRIDLICSCANHVTHLEDIRQPWGDVVAVTWHGLNEEVAYGHVEVRLEARPPNEEIFGVGRFRVFGLLGGEAVAAEQQEGEQHGGHVRWAGKNGRRKVASFRAWNTFPQTR